MRVQSLWIGGVLGTIQQLSVRSFLAQGHEFQLFTYDEVEGVPAGTTLCDASAILPKQDIFTYQDGFGKGSASAFSNLFRYKLIFERGGWWVDTDLVCMKPLNFETECVFASERSLQGDVTTASCAFTAPAGAEFLAYCLEVCESKDRRRLQWGEIGPRLMDDAVWRFGLEASRVPVDYFNPVHYNEFRDFTDPGFNFERIISSYGVHLWHEMWKNRGVSPDAAMPADSLFGMLRDRYRDPLSR